jgi:starch phosphorylase
MNGALTIGTYDGANVEIFEAVGEENFFLFGLRANQVQELKSKGYNPYEVYLGNAELKEVVDLLQSGIFSKGDKELFKPIVNSLLGTDPFLVLEDFQSYVECQQKVSWIYGDQKEWTKMSIINVAGMGKFSSDRSIREYCRKIWQVEINQ